ncbi:MAG: hypothetical protein ABS949_06725 [Solibacillus sp.]
MQKQQLVLTGQYQLLKPSMAHFFVYLIGEQCSEIAREKRLKKK